MDSWNKVILKGILLVQRMVGMERESEGQREEGRMEIDIAMRNSKEVRRRAE